MPDLQPIKEALAKATPGKVSLEPAERGTRVETVAGLPFAWCGMAYSSGIPDDQQIPPEQAEANAALIVLLRNNAEALVARVEAAEAEAQRLREQSYAAYLLHLRGSKGTLEGLLLDMAGKAQPAASEQGEGE